MRTLVIWALLGVSAIASASDCNERNEHETCDVSHISNFNECGNFDSYGELKCAYTLRAQNEAALNKAYTSTKSELKIDIMRLEQAQAAWVKFRDAECTYRTFSISEEMFKLKSKEFDLCMAELSQARTAQILSITSNCPLCPR